MRQEGRPEDEVADQDAPEAEKYQVDVESFSIQLEKHERQRLQLFHRNCAMGRMFMSCFEEDGRGVH